MDPTDPFRPSRWFRSLKGLRAYFRKYLVRITPFWRTYCTRVWRHTDIYNIMHPSANRDNRCAQTHNDIYIVLYARRFFFLIFYSDFVYTFERVALCYCAGLTRCTNDMYLLLYISLRGIKTFLWRNARTAYLQYTRCTFSKRILCVKFKLLYARRYTIF